jgi:hypothetical protein
VRWTSSIDHPHARQPSKRVENVGQALVAVGYAVMTLGILEIGGVFNIVVGLAGAWTGCLLMFVGEGRRESDDVAEFRKELDEL